MSEWNGHPENPERSGWHWLKHPEDLRPFPVMWDASIAAWCSGAAYSPTGIIDLGYCYLGPCLTHTEVAAREQAAAVAMRDEAAEYLLTLSATSPRWGSPEEHAEQIRALPVATDTLNGMLDQVWREGMEVAADIARKTAARRYAETKVCQSDRAKKHMQIRADEAGQIVAAICAAIEKEGE